MTIIHSCTVLCNIKERYYRESAWGFILLNDLQFLGVLEVEDLDDGKGTVARVVRELKVYANVQTSI